MLRVRAWSTSKASWRVPSPQGKQHPSAGRPRALLPVEYLAFRKHWDTARSEAEANFLTALVTSWQRKSRGSSSPGS